MNLSVEFFSLFKIQTNVVGDNHQQHFEPTFLTTELIANTPELRYGNYDSM